MLLLATALAGDLTSSIYYARTVEHCGVEIETTVDTAGFEAAGMKPQAAIDRCAESLHGLADACEQKKDDLGDYKRIKKLSCTYAEGRGIQMSHEDFEIQVKVGNGVSNIYSDAYDWMRRLKFPIVQSTETKADMTGTKMYQYAKTECGIDFPMTYDAQSFTSQDMSMEAAMERCSQSVRGMASACNEKPERKAVYQRVFTGAHCVYARGSGIEMNVNQGTLEVAVGKSTSNIYTDAYNWMAHLASMLK